MATRYFCDICKKEVSTSTDLKKVSISAIVTDNICDDQTRTVASLKIEMCRQCFIDNESTLRNEIEGLPNLLEAKT